VTRNPRPAVGWQARTVADCPVRVYQPAGAARGWLVWAHGGSWTRGSVAAWHEPCADLADRSGWAVVSTGYRLAPAHPHPAALLDVLAVTRWAGGLGGPVAVGGDSAGATIATCAALMLRGHARMPMLQVLAYPPLDPACHADSYGLDTFPTREDLRAAWAAYLGPEPRGSEPATPCEVEDLSGAAPAVLVVGDRDPVADDVRGYASRLRPVREDGRAARPGGAPGTRGTER
jgi:acetyl esterase